MEAGSSTAPKRAPRNAQRRGKGLPRRAQDLSKEELLLALQKKRECNARALKIVEGMLEPNVDEGWFLDMLQHINQSHYQDIIEERAITKLCGYPLCTNELKNIPSQQYRISTRLNKVYDIKDRKNFCSNKCFGASNFIKDQMHTSPLWLRDIEPKLKIVLMPSHGISGGSGEEVPVQVERVTREEVKRLSGADGSSIVNSDELKTDPSSERTLADALNNLHLVASLRKNSPPVFPEFTKYSSGMETEAISDESATICHQTEGLGVEISSNDQHAFSLHPTSDKNTGSSILTLIEGDVLRYKKEEPDCRGNNSQVSCCSNDHPSDVCIEETKPSDFTASQSNIQSNREIPEGLDVNDHKEAPALDGGLDEKSVELSTETSDVNSKVLPKSIDHFSLMQPPKTSSSDGSLAKQEIQFLQKVSFALDSASAPVKISMESESQDLSSFVLGLEKHRAPENYETTRSVSTKTDKTRGNISQKSHFKKQAQHVSHKPKSVVSHVEKCVEEWFTMETMCFLFGESALKDMLEQKGESIQEHYKALRSLTWDQEKHERFLAICKRLSLLEMEDNNFDNQIIRSEAEQKRKPLPDYSALKKEAEAMELKIRAFYQGKMQVDEKKVSFAEDAKTKSKEDQDDEHQIPLVHLHSQRALRKKIVLDGLNRVLPDFLRTFGMRPSELTGSVRGLVSTFAFSPSNITFKPQEWSLLGLIIIKLLALREPELKLCLQQEQSNTYLTLMLMSYKQEPGYLDRLLSWLTDIDKLLAKPESSDQP